MTETLPPPEFAALTLRGLARRLLAAERSRDRDAVAAVDAELRRRAAEAGEFGLMDGDDDGSVRAAFLACYRELLGA